MKTPYAPDRLRSYWLAHKGLLIVMILSGFGCNMLNAAVVIEQGQMLDQLILTGPGMALLEAAGQFLLLVLVVQLLRAIKRWTTRRFASVTSAAMRSALLTAVLNGRIDTEAGDLLNRGMQDVELCTDGMRKLTTELFDTGVLLGGDLQSDSAAAAAHPCGPGTDTSGFSASALRACLPWRQPGRLRLHRHP